MIWMVIQKGVYRHRVTGVFQSRDSAESWARVESRNEDDGYHNWEVVEYTNAISDGKIVVTIEGKKANAR